MFSTSNVLTVLTSSGIFNKAIPLGLTGVAPIFIFPLIQIPRPGSYSTAFKKIYKEKKNEKTGNFTTICCDPCRM